jgi:hypothetical protein
MPISKNPSRRGARRAAVLAAAALLGACDGASGPREPTPGQLVVRTETPNIDRAFLIQVSGPAPITAVAAAPGRTVVGSGGSTTVKAAVFGSGLNGDVMLVSVPDVNRAREYTVTLLEASGTDNQLRASLAGYRVTISR